MTQVHPWSATTLPLVLLRAHYPDLCKASIHRQPQHTCQGTVQEVSPPTIYSWSSGPTDVGPALLNVAEFGSGQHPLDELLLSTSPHPFLP